jgi:hypothetical protein
VKIKVNFKADHPTVNGHIYPKEVLKKAFDERFKTDVYVSCVNSGTVRIDEIVAKAESYEITPESEILVDMKILDTSAGKQFKDENFEISTYGVGIFEDEDHIIISDQYKLSHFYIVKENKG